MGIFKKYKGVEWKGHIVSNGKKEPMAITNMVCDTLGRLTGNGKDKQGKFDIFGFVSEQGVFTFQKIYKKKKFNTPDNPKFQAMFQSGALIGNYFAPGTMGTFYLKLSNGILFVGNYQRSDIPFPLQASMYLQVDKKLGVFGVGCDHNGFYVARGQKLKTDKAAKKGKYKEFFFIVSYIGKFQIQHHAIGKEEVKGIRCLNGQWLNTQLSLSGTFKLTEVKKQKYKKNKKDKFAQKNVPQDQMLHSSMFGLRSFNVQQYHQIGSMRASINPFEQNQTQNYNPYCGQTQPHQFNLPQQQAQPQNAPFPQSANVQQNPFSGSQNQNNFNNMNNKGMGTGGNTGYTRMNPGNLANNNAKQADIPPCKDIPVAAPVVNPHYISRPQEPINFNKYQ